MNKPDRRRANPEGCHRPEAAQSRENSVSLHDGLSPRSHQRQRQHFSMTLPDDTAAMSTGDKTLCHSRAGGNDRGCAADWIPACVGMTSRKDWKTLNGNRPAHLYLHRHCPVGRDPGFTRRLGNAAGLGPYLRTYHHFADCPHRVLPGHRNAKPPKTGELRMAARKYVKTTVLSASFDEQRAIYLWVRFESDIQPL